MRRFAYFLQVALLSILLSPPAARAGCTLRRECVAASGAGSMSQQYPDETSCKRDETRGNQYQGCTYRCVCSGGSSDGASGMTGMSPGNALMYQTMQQLSFSLGQALGSALTGGGAEDRGQRQAEEAALLEDERLRTREGERKRRFEADKQDLLSGFKGASASEDLALKDGEPHAQELSFKECHERESQRQESIKRVSNQAVNAIQKSVRDWCRRHPVLTPARSAYSDSREYEANLTSFEERHKAWLDYCNQDFTKTAPQLMIVEPGGDPRRLKRFAESDCFGAFKKGSAACADHVSLLEHSNCLNTQLKSLDKCKAQPVAAGATKTAPAPQDPAKDGNVHKRLNSR